MSSKPGMHVRWAVLLYAKFAAAERRAAQYEHELNEVATLIPNPDLEYYVEQTEEIQAKEDRKLEDFLLRKHRR